jgi:hypothetical protein
MKYSNYLIVKIHYSNNMIVKMKLLLTSQIFKRSTLQVFLVIKLTLVFTDVTFLGLLSWIIGESEVRYRQLEIVDGFARDGDVGLGQPVNGHRFRSGRVADVGRHRIHFRIVIVFPDKERSYWYFWLRKLTETKFAKEPPKSNIYNYI